MQLPTDPMILELFPEFVDTWINDINEQYTPLLEAKDQKELYRMAHTLKGSGFQFGIQELGESGLALMKEINEANWEVVASYKDKLLEILKHARDIYDSTYNVK